MLRSLGPGAPWAFDGLMDGSQHMACLQLSHSTVVDYKFIHIFIRCDLASYGENSTRDDDHCQRCVMAVGGQALYPRVRADPCAAPVHSPAPPAPSVAFWVDDNAIDTGHPRAYKMALTRRLDASSVTFPPFRGLPNSTSYRIWSASSIVLILLRPLGRHKHIRNTP